MNYILGYYEIFIIYLSKSNLFSNLMMSILFSAILPMIVSAIVSYLVAYIVIKNDEKKELHNQLNDIINIAITYPYLEDEIYTKSWTEESLRDSDIETREKSIRYEYYAIKIFNYLERYGKHYGWMITTMEKDFNIEEWVKLHISMWNQSFDKEDYKTGYCIELRYLIDRYKSKWKSQEKPL